ncbi:hypothetical protein ACLMJK_004039 [Lecanora helva]
MSSPDLTVRNLTSNTVHVKHYETHESRTNGISTSNLKSLSSFWSTSVTSEPPRSTLEDVSVVIEPLQIGTASVRTAKPPQETISIVFEIKGHLYQSNIIKPTVQSQILLPLTPDAPRDHSVVYHPQHHHLTVLSHSNPSSWMRHIGDAIPLSALSIPGTHNSPTYHRALPSVRCQVAPVRDQLAQGVRFLDIRVQPESPLDPTKDTLNLVHAVFPISLTGQKRFRPLVEEVLSFLEKNPSETIIMSVKREGPGNATDAQLSRILRDHYAGDVNKWFTAPRIPSLGEARGKIVLVRRFTLEERLKNEWAGAGWCIDADTWADNTPNSLCPSGDLCIQDFYEVLETENIEKKIQYSIDHLKRAAKCVCPSPDSGTKQPFYINFLTASNFWKQSCWPDKIAAKLNPAIVDFLCTKHNMSEDDCGIGDGSTGIVVCDWIGADGDWSIVDCILGYNAKFTTKK